MPKYVGPYKIIKKVSPVNYRLKIGKYTVTVHSNRLKEYYEEIPRLYTTPYQLLSLFFSSTDSYFY